MDKIFLVVVCGATASGKTRLAIDLAKLFDGEVVSADSMQIYKTLDIASAKPTAKEMDGVPHHLIDFLEPTEAFSVADYVELAREKIADISKRGKLPIICGGTGLYINSLIDNIIFDDTQGDSSLREELAEFAEKNGNEALWERLKKIDEKAAAELHPNNRNRIIRAIEIYEKSGRTITDAKVNSRLLESPYEPLMLQITYEDRETLYQRINKRVDLMLEAGLVEEAREFFSHSNYVTASQAIGCKELKPYLDGEKSLDECVEHLKMQTRRYAKRQLTWFRRDSRINCLEMTKDGSYENLLKKAEKLVKTYRKII